MIDIRGLPKNVIIVDDDKQRSLALAHLVKRFGYNVFVAGTCQGLSGFAGRFIPHIALLDIKLKSEKAKLCIDNIQDAHLPGEMKVITLGDASDEKLLEESLYKGAHKFLVRPVLPTPLVKLMESLTETTPRTVPRLDIIFKVTIRWAEGERTNYATMISEKGVFVATGDLLEEGTKVSLSMDLPGKKPVLADGEVIYILSEGVARLQSAGMGIRFLDFPVKLQEALRHFIDGRFLEEPPESVLI